MLQIIKTISHWVSESEFVAEIDFLDLLVGQDGVGIAGSDDVAAGNNVGILADVQGLTHVVVGDQNANALVPEMPDDVFDVADGYRGRLRRRVRPAG